MIAPEVILEGRRLRAVWEADPQNLNTGFECWLLDHAAALLDAAEVARELRQIVDQDIMAMTTAIRMNLNLKDEVVRLQAELEAARELADVLMGNLNAAGAELDKSVRVTVHATDGRDVVFEVPRMRPKEGEVHDDHEG